MTFIQLASHILLLMVVATCTIQLKLEQSGSSEVQKNKTRMISWWIMFGISVVVIYVNAWILFFAVLIASGWATVEVVQLSKPQSTLPVFSICIFVTIVYAFLWRSNNESQVLWFFLPLACAVIALFTSPSTTISNLFCTAAIAGGLMCMLLLAKHSLHFDRDVRVILLLLLFLTTANDIAQYCVGKLFGRRPLSSLISPNKTIEGAIGGIVITTLLCAFILPGIILVPWHWCAFVGLVTASAGIVGDLFISRLKRYAGAKDSGQLIPGHGGLLDRTDSLIMTAPVFGYLLVTTMDNFS